MWASRSKCGRNGRAKGELGPSPTRAPALRPAQGRQKQTLLKKLSPLKPRLVDVLKSRCEEKGRAMVRPPVDAVLPYNSILHMNDKMYVLGHI